MHMRAKKNEYQEAFPAYDKTPKAVIAALAMSLAMRLTEDSPENARALLHDEWHNLHIARVLPQKPVPYNAGGKP